MKKFNLIFLLAGLLCLQVQAQRYLSPVFTDVQVTTDITYGVNATALLLTLVNEAVPEELIMDVYEPIGDTVSNRPLVVMMHTGNFLPPSVNGGCTGTRKDATAVNLANRLAKMGYVVASIDYRLGWNPVADTQTGRIFGIINAAYRGVQDSRTVVRYFKKSVAESENPYRVDPEKIVMWGIGTGGYISLAAATLDTITDTQIPKFLIQLDATTFVPMVQEEINGNVDGTTFGVVPPGFEALLPFPAGDTLNYPNHVGYDSDFQFAVNMGGALGDSSWIDPGDVPMISFHVPTDPFAPCEDGVVLVPVVGLSVVDVSGSCKAQSIMNSQGVNAVINDNGPYSDPISDVARSRNGGLESLFLFPSSDPTEAGQWSYSFSEDPYGVGAELGANVPCDTGTMVPNLYLDTIMAYYAPRAFAALGLGSTSATLDLIPAQEVGLKLIPNPATAQVMIQTEAEFPIQEMRLFDLNGRMLERRANVNNNQVRLERRSLPAGVYIVKLRIKDRIVAQKLVFK